MFPLCFHYVSPSVSGLRFCSHSRPVGTFCGLSQGHKVCWRILAGVRERVQRVRITPPVLLFSGKTTALLAEEGYILMSRHPKSVRRRILEVLYEKYLKDPLDMPAPDDLLEDGTIAREDLVSNAFYLHDRGLIELMIGYAPPMFAAAHISADGIDLVENEFEFNLRFPKLPGQTEEAAREIPQLVERLVAEADFSPLDGEARKCLLRDVQYLRDELARPAVRWRTTVIESVLKWIAEQFDAPDDVLPSLAGLREAIDEKGVQGKRASTSRRKNTSKRTRHPRSERK